MQSPRCQLHEEIEFWEEMIARPVGTTNAEARERMEQALALARRKLRMLQDTGPERKFAPPADPVRKREH